MNELVGQVLPQAAGMAISPIPIVATILILLSPHARTAAPAFLGGWIAGVVVAVTAFTLLGSLLPEPDPDDRRLILAVIDLTLGILLAVLAAHQWRNRPKPGEPPELPGWLRVVTSMGPAKAAGLAFVLSSVNPKNLLLAASAGVTIGTAGAGNSIAIVTVFTVIASSTVAVPVVAFLLAGDRMAGPLDQVRAWLVRKNAAIMGTLLAVLGVVLIGKGVAAL